MLPDIVGLLFNSVCCSMMLADSREAPMKQVMIEITSYIAAFDVINFIIILKSSSINT
jgi:hypothetical protein